MAGAVQQPVQAVRGRHAAEVAEHHQAGIVQAGVGHGRPVSGQAVRPDRHVRRPGHRGDLVPAGLEQVLHGHPGPAGVVRVDVGDPLVVPDGAAREHDRHAEAVQVERALPVHADQQDAVHMPAAQVPGDDLVLAWRVGGEQDELDVAGRQLAADPPQHEREERLGEDLPAVLAHQEGDRSGAARRRGPRRPVAHVTQLDNGRLDLAARLRPDPGGAGQHPRRRGRRDSGLLRDVS